MRNQGRAFGPTFLVAVLAAWIGLSPNVCAQPADTPNVTSVSFSGNTRFRDSRLRDIAGITVGSPLSLFQVRDGREAIQRLYRDAGHSEVEVHFEPGRLGSGAVVYVIDEGIQTRIRRIIFEGNASFSERELKRKLETKTAFWIFRSGAFDEDRLQGDLMRLQNFYREEGFLDARASFRREAGAKGRRLTVVISIDEGVRYLLEPIEVRGAAAISEGDIRNLMESRDGDVVLRRRIAADVEKVRNAYGRQGYIYATVRAVQVFSNRPGSVRLAIEISEGDQFRVGRVEVRGNTRTRDKVARRALNLFPPDDLFDLTEVKAAERRLRETRVFSSARIYPVGDAPGHRDILIDVQEAEKAGDFLFGFGITSNSGVIGNIVLDLQNFDLADKPRSWAELRKLRAFFGGGQRLRLELQPGTDLSRFRLDFSDPYFRDKPVRFDFSGYAFGRGRDGYDERRLGLNVGFGKRFERGLWQGWSGEIAFRVENVSVQDVELFSSKEIREDEGSNLLTSIKGTLVRDRTDSRFVATRGDRLRISYEQYGIFGGEFGFGKLGVAYDHYRTVKTDAFDRKSVLHLRAKGGVIIGDAPVFERFFAGGTGSIRGFQFRGVGERDGIDDNNIGGDYRILLGAEYSFPLVGDNVRGLFFLDTGAVGSGTWRAALGTGIRFTLNIFGGVPIELDLAIPISSDEGDDTQVFSFLFGGIF